MGSSILISSSELAARIGEPGLRIVDVSVTTGADSAFVSDADAYEQGHIPGAVLADLVSDFSDAESPYGFTVPTPERFAEAASRLGITNGDDVVIYSRDALVWATRLWWLFRYFGAERVKVLDGGITAWEADGRTLDVGKNANTAGVFRSKPNPALLATTADVKCLVDQRPEGTRLVSALAQSTFDGTAESYGRRGHIPGSHSVPSGALFDHDSGRFRSAEELRIIFHDAGIGERDDVVTYCGGGVAGSLELFALSLAGNDHAKLYDGSLEEWSRSGLPLEVPSERVV